MKGVTLIRAESFIRLATKLKSATAFLPLGGLITGKTLSDSALYRFEDN
jgi:hypothetical protein